MASFVFELGGGREMVGIEKVTELLAPALSVTNPNQLRLSNKSFSHEAAISIAAAIEKYDSFTNVDISDIIAGRHEDEALRTLKTISDALSRNTLTEINLSDNAFGRKGVEACKSVLVSKSLQRIYLCNNGLSAEACQLVSEILREGGCPPLTLLNFYNNMSGDGGAIAISSLLLECPQLQDFRFSATRVAPVGCLVISEALASLSSLTKLDLADNTFDHKASVALAEAVKKQSNLTTLILRDCGLGDVGSLSILRAVTGGETPSGLRVLDLSGNDISVETMGEFGTTALRSLPALQELYLDDNEIPSDAAVTFAKAVEKHRPSQLTLLSLETCELTAAAAVALARAVTKIETFRTLRLNGNAICGTGVEIVRELFDRYSKVLSDMDDNDEDGEDDLEDLEDETGAEVDELAETMAKTAI